MNTPSLPVHEEINALPCLGCDVASRTVFARLGPSEVKDVLEAKHLHNFTKGMAIIAEGETCDAVHCFYKGKAISTRRVDEREQFLAFVPVGELIGLRNVVSVGPATASITAIDDSMTCRIPLDVIRELADEHPPFRLQILSQLSRRTESVEGQGIRLFRLSGEKRLPAFLFHAWEVYGSSNGAPLLLRLLPEELGGLLGISARLVHDVLNKLEKRGALLQSEAGITIVAPYRLLP